MDKAHVGKLARDPDSPFGCIMSSCGDWISVTSGCSQAWRVLPFMSRYKLSVTGICALSAG